MGNQIPTVAAIAILAGVVRFAADHDDIPTVAAIAILAGVVRFAAQKRTLRINRT